MSAISIVFEFNSKYGVYRDALHLPEGHGLTDDQITAMQRERFDNWINVIENPPRPPETIQIGDVTYEKIEVDGNTVLKPIEV